MTPTMDHGTPILYEEDYMNLTLWVASLMALPAGTLDRIESTPRGSVYVVEYVDIDNDSRILMLEADLIYPLGAKEGDSVWMLG